MMRDKLLLIGKYITIIAALGGVVWGGIFGYMVFVFLHSPPHPVQESGNIVPWSNHGIMHYVTRFEKDVFDQLWGAAWVIIVIGFIGLALYRGRSMFNRQ